LQTYYLIEDTLGKWKNSPFEPDKLSYPTHNSCWDAVERILLRKLGTSHLAEGPSSCARVYNYILKCDPHEFLMIILAFLLVVRELAAGVCRPIIRIKAWLGFVGHNALKSQQALLLTRVIISSFSNRWPLHRCHV
jgi:hypothetical protein